MGQFTHGVGGALVELFAVACDPSSPITAPQAARVGRPGSVLAAPSNLRVVAATGNRIDVAWQDNSTDETQYELWRSSEGTAGPFTLRTVAATNVVAFADSGWQVDAVTAYCYRLRGVRQDRKGTVYSPFSNVACVSSGAVQIIAVTTGVDFDLDGYGVYLQTLTEHGLANVRSAELGVNASATFANLRVGDYQASIAGVAAHCTLNTAIPRAAPVVPGQTTAVHFEVSCGPRRLPGPPSLFPPQGYYLGTIWLSWMSGAQDGEGFKIERCDQTTCAEGDFVVIATAGPHINLYMDRVAEGVTYTYRIRATDALGDSDPSNLGYGRSCLEEVDWYSPCYP
ncbi:MAG: hypothetical protein ACREMJ_02600 [Gemmatimonadales bacterium]